MKHAAMFAALFAACTNAPDITAPEPTEPEAPASPVAHPDTCPGADHLTSEPWVNGSSNDAIWPTGCFTSTEILLRKGPANPDTGAANTFLAFVVWNDQIVGHIYWVDIGSNGSDFYNVKDAAYAAHLNQYPDHFGGAGGSPDGGNAPIPHPHVDGFYHVDVTQNYLDNFVKVASQDMHQAYVDLNVVEK